MDRPSITGKNGQLKVLLSQSQSAISPEVMACHVNKHQNNKFQRADFKKQL
jgi:hypothetical protein